MSAGPAGPRGVPAIELWQEPSRLWRWRYLEPSADARPPLELLANRDFDSREDALRSATTAYPGVPVRERVATPPARRRGSLTRDRLLALAVIALVVFVLWPRRRSRGDGLRSAAGPGR